MFDKAQLVERGRHYFDDPKIAKMYATSDGNFFYEDSKNYADSHAKSLKTPVVEITRGDLATKKSKKSKEAKPKAPSGSSENSLSIEELRAEGKRLKIPKYWIIKEETLRKKIAEANGTA